MGRIRPHLTYANVMSTIAVFGVLAGGVAVAANTAPKNSVVTKSIRNGAVTPPKLGCKGNSSDDVMVKVGSACIDRYENSIWDAPKGGNRITGVIPCNANGQDCKGVIFARSVAGVPPRAAISWFQMQQALANSGKRLPTNAEWQTAVAGTPDPGASPGSEDCNTAGPSSPEATGERANCVSDWGANDMVGNLAEWTADWDELAETCTNWNSDFGSDRTCVGDPTPTGLPSALLRGGSGVAGGMGTDAGPFTVTGNSTLSGAGGLALGFRGAR